MNYQDNYKLAAEALKSAQSPVFVAHRKPDGDSLGASLALHFILKLMGKQTTLACVDMPASRFDFLPDINRFQKTFSYDSHDLIVVSDAGDKKMSNFHDKISRFLSNEIPILNIDHHISNDMYGRINLVDPSCASTTVIVYKLMKLLGLPPTPEIAVCILTGIYNDTGSFMHSNTNLEAFKIAAEMMQVGVDVSVISKYMFRAKPISQLKLWGLILGRLKCNRKNVVSSVISLSDIHHIGSNSEETGGIIDLISTVSGAEFTMLLAEDEKGFVKGSFRTQKDDVDVAKIAADFGGGGHKKAAGFRMFGRLKQETVWKIETPEAGEERIVCDV